MFSPQNKCHHEFASDLARHHMNLIETHLHSRLALFISILFLHFMVIIAWQSTPRSSSQVQPNKQILFLISKATIKPIAPIKSSILTSNRGLTKTIHANTINPQITSTKLQVLDLPVINEPAKIIDNPLDSNSLPIPLQKNIRELTLSLKEDFSKQEKNFRPDSQSQQESIKKFSNAIAEAAKIQREGTVIEKKFAYDGRPVSKIKTPYGTYCVRHPKAGEKLELAPPPLPVSCGRL